MSSPNGMTLLREKEHVCNALVVYIKLSHEAVIKKLLLQIKWTVIFLYKNKYIIYSRIICCVLIYLKEKKRQYRNYIRPILKL